MSIHDEDTLCQIVKFALLHLSAVVVVMDVVARRTAIVEVLERCLVSWRVNTHQAYIGTVNPGIIVVREG